MRRYDAAQPIAGGRTATGTVVSVTTGQNCGRHGCSAYWVPAIQFTAANGRTVTFAGPESGTPIDTGGQVQVSYDPGNPASARDVSAGAQITVDRDRDKNPVVALREIAETKLDQAALKDTLIQGMQKHADIDKPEEVNEMAELEQELAAALAQGGAEAAQPKALPMAEEDDVTE